MPIRVAITGQPHGRDLNETLALIGREKVLERLRDRGRIESGATPPIVIVSLCRYTDSYKYRKRERR